QKQIIAFFMEYPDPIDQKLLCDQLNIQRSNIKPLLDKGYLTEERVEVYRNPYDRDFEKTTNLTLTDEQQIAVNRIHESIQKEQDTTFLLHGVKMLYLVSSGLIHGCDSPQFVVHLLMLN